MPTIEKLERLKYLQDKLDTGESLTSEEQQEYAKLCDRAMDVFPSLMNKLLLDIATGNQQVIRLVSGVYSLWLMVEPHEDLHNVLFDCLYKTGDILYNIIMKK